MTVNAPPGSSLADKLATLRQEHKQTQAAIERQRVGLLQLQSLEQRQIGAIAVLEQMQREAEPEGGAPKAAEAA